MRRRSEFGLAVRGGSRAGRPCLVVHCGGGGTSSAGPALVGVVVSRAVGPAVVRNRVKRRIRHVVRERLGTLPAGALVVVRANPAAADASSERLGQEFEGALSDALRKRRRIVERSTS